jgi:uncharacterized phage protein gp47/JayE
MALFVPMVFEDILQRMANRLIARSTLNDLSETSAAKTILAACAREIDALYFQMGNILSAFSIEKAAGSDLDARAADFNLTRNPATAGVGTMTFTASGAPVPVPIGTRIKIPGENPEIVAVTTAAGNTGAPIASVLEKPGVVAAVGTLTAFKSAKPAGVESVTNAVPFSGQAEETDDAFRARIKAYIETLARCTVEALEFVASTVALDSGQRVVFSRVFEDPVNLGRVYLYVDDGAGTAEATDDNVGAPEILTSGPEFPGDVAVGGEEYLYTDNFPIKDAASIAVEKNGTPLTRDVDYTLNSASGQIFLTTPLDPGDDVTIEYTWYIDLIAEVQKVVDGDPNDRVNYPGWRAAGVQVLVRPPVIIGTVIEIGIVVLDGFDRATVAAAVETEIAKYINGLGIGNDVVVSEIVERAMSVQGMYDCTVFAPAANITIAPEQLPRSDSSSITVT